MLDTLIAKAQEYSAHKVDFPVSSRDIAFDPLDCGLVLGGGATSTKLHMTDWARNQLYAKMEPTIFNIPAAEDEQRRGRKSWKEYLDACDPTMRSIHLNHWTNAMNSKLFVRAYDDKARAILSDRFAAVDVSECLEWVKQALNQQTHAYKFHNVSLNPDYFRMSITMSELNVPDGGRSRPTGGNYGVGCDIGTGEIGNARLWCNPYIQRTSCSNSIAYTKSDFAFTHRHVGIREVMTRSFVVSVFNALKGCEEILRRLVASLEEPLPNLDDLISDMCKRNQWSQETGYAIAIGAEGESNLWGLVQGVSYAANSIEDEDAKLRMHNLAGELLMAGYQDEREL